MTGSAAADIADGRGTFVRRLAALTALALAVRLVYALAIVDDPTGVGDAILYHVIAHALADGHGYANALFGEYAPTATHPPLYPLVLAGFFKLGLGSFNDQQAITCLMGTAAVALIGLLSRRLADPRAGLIAAGVAAVYPPLFVVDGSAIADALYVPLIAATLLLAYRLIDRPAPSVAVALGAVIGLATLTRSEGILLLVLVVVPVAVIRGGHRRWRLLAACAAATAVVLAPWLLRNQLTLERFPLLSTNGALTAPAANCYETYFGPKIGFVGHGCALRSPCLRIKTEVPRSECLGREAWSFVRDHERRLPLVLLAREARTWQVYGIRNDISYSTVWGRPRGISTAGLVFYALLLPLAVVGGLQLRRRGEPLVPLLAPFVLATAVAAMAFGFSRYRLAAEIPLVVLGAVAIDHLLSPPRARRLMRLRHGRAVQAG
jgi:4-amino-4-deoxy-L-arabinose transferase-like glycosyltransferase